MTPDPSVRSDEKGFEPGGLLPAASEHPTPLRLLLLIALATFVGEALVMFILMALPPFAPLSEALLDAMMLTVMVFPFLYLFLYRPMVLEIENRQRAEAELRTLNETLEQQVAARTADLSGANERLRKEIEVRKQTENDLWKNSEFTRTVVESAPCLLMIYNVGARRCSFVNGRIDALLSYEPEEVTSGAGDFLERKMDREEYLRWLDRCRSAEFGREGEMVGERLRIRDSGGIWRELKVGIVVLSRSSDDVPEEILLSAIPAE